MNKTGEAISRDEVMQILWDYDCTNENALMIKEISELPPIESKSNKGEKRMSTIDILRILFPALMVIGAFGSMVTNIVSKGENPVSLQWLGACLLYTALLLRNRG